MTLGATGTGGLPVGLGQLAGALGACQLPRQLALQACQLALEHRPGRHELRRVARPHRPGSLGAGRLDGARKLGAQPRQLGPGDVELVPPPLGLGPQGACLAVGPVPPVLGATGSLLGRVGSGRRLGQPASAALRWAASTATALALSGEGLVQPAHRRQLSLGALRQVGASRMSHC